MKHIKKSVQHLPPPVILSLGFLILILFGAMLLKLPFATYEPISWLQALFTTTSAVTVTGLLVVDTAQFTQFGQIIIAGLIQLGGLGFMTFAVLAFFSLQRRLNLAGQIVAREALGQTSFGNIFETAKAVLLISFVIEAIGFIGLTLSFSSRMDWFDAMYHGFFYTISAFNNAGFALSSASLMPYVDHVGVNIIITALIIFGGLGFLVIQDIYKNRRWQKLNINTKLMLSATLVINLLAFLLFWLLEHNNPETLGALTPSEQIIAAWFQAITPRTAGFNTIAIEHLTDAGTLLTMFLMFIGGGTLSTASGIKVGTFVVLILTTWAFLRQHSHVTAFERTISEIKVRKALALISITMLLIFLSVFILSIIEPHHELVDVLFEVVSALSTVGLSRGITSQLSPLGEVVIMFMMFAGRVGPLTLAYFIAVPKQKRVRYPEANVLIG